MYHAERCQSCQKALESDEIALTKKLVNRAAESFLCKKCLAEKFNISEDAADKLIANFKAAGCSLFK